MSWTLASPSLQILRTTSNPHFGLGVVGWGVDLLIGVGELGVAQNVQSQGNPQVLVVGCHLPSCDFGAHVCGCHSHMTSRETRQVL